MQNEDLTKVRDPRAAEESDPHGLGEDGFEQPYETHEAQEPEPLLGDGTVLKRIAIVLGVFVFFALLVTLPPLVNVSRYQRRIATSISASLGRPVHLDSVTLTMLPMPGFTITNFVVSEDPAFGSEPVIRANVVRATLRMSSLWRRRVEFSTISLTEPSVNLVHLPDGRWNLESILLQASRMPAAPTVQKASGETQRFPYIEATDARVNLKLGIEKVPFALTEAEFALWLPEPQQWHLRLEAHPARTDTSVSDTGTLRVEGTLGRAHTLADVPIDLTAEWDTVPLGAVSLIALGSDANMRGEMTLTASAHGTVGNHAETAHLKLTGLRRADFVPNHPIDVDIRCSATATRILHALKDVRCLWPTATSKPEAPSGLSFTGELPDTHQPSTLFGDLTVTSVPAANLLDGLRVSSRRLNRDLTFDGLFSGTLTRPANAPVESTSGAFTIKDARIALGKTVFVKSDLTATVTGLHADVAPIPVDFGAHESALIGGSADPSGLQLTLHGSLPSGLMKLFNPPTQSIAGKSVPPAPPAFVQVDEQLHRPWGIDQPWTITTPIKTKPTHPRHR